MNDRTRSGKNNKVHLKIGPRSVLLDVVADVTAAWSDPGLSSYRKQGIGLQARPKTNSPVCHQGEGAIPLPQQKYKRKLDHDAW
jgi:hypothetical protein